MICRQCGQTRKLTDFISSNSRLLYRCKKCIAYNERIDKFQKNNCIEMNCCQDLSCPDKYIIGSDIRLLRFRDDGRVACLGCCRFKNRRGRKHKHRLAMKGFFSGRCCFFCGRAYEKDKLDIYFFEMVDESMDILTYSKFTNVSSKNIDRFLELFVSNIVCIFCARTHLTSHLR